MNAQDLIKHLQEAVDLSKKGLGYVSPNPCVGCVILDAQGKKIAEGFHEKYGEAHAEVNALKQLQDPMKQLQGAYVIVTLEPCAHEGKTPSCAKTLSQYPIEAVIALVKDPNPLVCGQGFEILQQAGHKTIFIEDILSSAPSRVGKEWNPEWEKIFLEWQTHPQSQKRVQAIVNESQNLNKEFFFAIQHQRPFVTLKWAQSLNGVIGSPYKRLLISGKKAQEHTHHLRATHDVTLVGYKTILQDNPSLNVRLGQIQKENKVAVVDSRLRILDQRAKHNIFNVHSPQNLFLITDQELKGQEKCEGFSGNLIFVGRDLKGQLNLVEAMKQLRVDHNIHSIFVEGGADILKDMYEQNLWNEIYIYIAPKFLKGIEIKLSVFRIVFKFFKTVKLFILYPDIGVRIRQR